VFRSYVIEKKFLSFCRQKLPDLGVKKDPHYYACALCARRYKSEKALRWHEVKHSGQRPHQCHLCHKSFFFKGMCHENGGEGGTSVAGVEKI
jgi:hypothetical protein